MAEFQEDLYEVVNQLIIRQMAANGAPGVALAITDRKKILRLAAYGLADIAGHKPVISDTLFEIGSIGKSFTSLALLQLHEDGRLDLHAPVTQYLPWFQVQSNYPPITLHHLLTHTAGLIRGTDFAVDALPEVWALRDTAVVSPPGERFYYSNVGYKILGLVLETVYGQPYGEIIRTHILEPLGMAATDPIITHDTRRRLAVGYQYWYDDRPGRADSPLAPAPWLETATGDGCIASTAGDMATYVRMLLNRGEGPQGPLLSSAGFELMSQPVIKVEEDSEIYYGYALDIETREEHTYLGHGGDMVGYVASILADMEAGLGVVLLSNGPFKPVRTARAILDLLRAAREGQAFALPPLPDPTRIEQAADYAGVYRANGKSLSLVAEDEHLMLVEPSGATPFEGRGPDTFYLDHPDYSRFLWHFQRETNGTEPGPVLGAGHGPDWYAHERYTGPTSFEHPAIWAAYPGHYRAYNPWYSNFRVVLRQGELYLIWPWGQEELLVPLKEGEFRVGAEEHSPERLRFEALLEGRTLRVNLNGADFYRFFTP